MLFLSPFSSLDLYICTSVYSPLLCISISCFSFLCISNLHSTSLYISICALSPLCISVFLLPLLAPTCPVELVGGRWEAGNRSAAWKRAFAPGLGEDLWVCGCSVGSVSHTHTHHTHIPPYLEFAVSQLPAPSVLSRKCFGKVYLGLCL